VTPLDWYAINLPHPHETISGDGHVVQVSEDDALFVGIDGLGHGPKAATAAQAAVDAVQAFPAEAPTVMMDRLHRVLRGTRGAVVTIARLNLQTGSLTWTGIGNVSATVVRVADDGTDSRDRLLLRGGVVGFKIPTVKVFKTTFQRGDTLLLASDGIRSDFLNDVPADLSSTEIAQHIMQHYRRETDDATIIVVRYAS